jgi:lipopolysaccharide export system protein LptC
MAAGPGLHSRLVAILKVLLPLVALGMLAALFLIQTEDELGSGVVFSEGDIAALGEGLRVTNPTFSGMTEDDDRFRFQAEEVIPDAAPPTRADITALTGRIDFVDGRAVEVASRTAELDLSRNRLELVGEVRVETSDGYVLRAERLGVDLDTGLLEAGDTVTTEGPPGTITSGTMRIEPPQGAGEDRRFSFGNGVRLVYDPPAEPE